MSTSTPGRMVARRISRDDAVERIAATETLSAARLKAEEIIRKATLHSDQLRAEAEEEAERCRNTIYEIADAELLEFVNTARVEKSAQAFVEILSASSRLQQEFDALQPWLVELVMGSVRQIIGELSPDERMRRIIDVGMSETRTRWNLMLRVHPDIQHDMEVLLAKYSDRFKTIVEVQSDADMDAGGCVLVGAGGVLDLGLETQLSELEKVLESSLVEECPA